MAKRVYKSGTNDTLCADIVSVSSGRGNGGAQGGYVITRVEKLSVAPEDLRGYKGGWPLLPATVYATEASAARAAAKAGYRPTQH